MKLTEEDILLWLEEVKDPEIPVLSLVDLGVITNVEVLADNSVLIEMTPTFAGCPAMDYMKHEVEEVLEKNNISSYRVEVSFETPWNSNMISEKGRMSLQQFGLAPPQKHNLIVDLDIIEHATCPLCCSNNTVMQSPFGPTLCRSIHFCNDCRQTFEQFKPI